MKEFLNEQELKDLRGGNHGGLKFEVYDASEKLVSVTRVTISGGLDYCNNFVDKIDAPNDHIFKVVIYKRYGSGRGQWGSVARLERTKDSLFNH